MTTAENARNPLTRSGTSETVLTAVLGISSPMPVAAFSGIPALSTVEGEAFIGGCSEWEGSCLDFTLQTLAGHTVEERKVFSHGCRQRPLASSVLSFHKLASMAAAGAIRFNPAAARGKIIYHTKESTPVIRPIAISIGECGGRRDSAFRHSLAGGQDDAARGALAADPRDLRAEVIPGGQERLVLPAVCRSGMAHGAAICAIF